MNRVQTTAGKDEAAKRRVFLVDDHPLVREHLAQLIAQQADMRVCWEAGDLAEAVEAIGRLQPDVAVVDLSLRNSSGLDLLKELKARGIPVPVLVLSMHDENLYAERAIRAGAFGYINKQETSKAILAAIRRVIDRQLHLSDELAASLLRKALGSAASEVSDVNRLADRELEVFQLIGRGYGTRRIAEHMSLSVKTVESYRARIKEKLQIEDGVQLVRRAVQWMEVYGSGPGGNPGL